MKRIAALLLSLLLALSICACAPAAAPEETPAAQPAEAPAPTEAPAPVEEEPEAAYTAGTYEATVAGMWGPLTVEAEFSEEAIVNVEVVDHVETVGISLWPVSLIPERIVADQTLAVDTVSGVTVTSYAIINAVSECVKLAGGDPAELQGAPTAEEVAPEYVADVVVVGGGGAGLSAATAATEAGASVIIVEKAGVLGGNSVVAGGIYNCYDPELQATAQMTDGYRAEIEAALAEEPVSEIHGEIQKLLSEQYEEYKASGSTTIFDSPEWHALQTWIGGDRIGQLDLIWTLTKNALPGLQWAQSMGYEIQDRIGQGSGSLYMRTHFSVLPNTWGIIKAFIETLEARQDQVTILYETPANELIVEDGRVVGVKATTEEGVDVTVKGTKGVILSTGGFAGDVELRQQYCEGEKWPDLGAGLNTTNVKSNTGDGIRMAEAIGAGLVDMDQIQLLHITNPKTGTSGDASVPQSTAGYILVNQEGKRFVREDGRRDEISQAIMAQTGGYSWLIQSADIVTDPDNQKTTLGQTITYMLENKLSDYVCAETLEELAEVIGVPYENLQATLDSYNAAVANAGGDEFGRVLLVNQLVTGPWYAFTRAPSAHHTMGGVTINTNTEVLDVNGNVIPGLYAAGEITGGIHGGNRLGGNAIVDFTVFGRIAGTNAAAN